MSSTRTSTAPRAFRGAEMTTNPSPTDTVRAASGFPAALRRAGRHHAGRRAPGSPQGEIVDQRRRHASARGPRRRRIPAPHGPRHAHPGRRAPPVSRTARRGHPDVPGRRCLGAVRALGCGPSRHCWRPWRRSPPATTTPGPTRRRDPEPVAEPTVDLEEAQQTYHPLVAAVVEALADVSVPGRPDGDPEVIYYNGDLESALRLPALRVRHRLR